MTDFNSLERFDLAQMHLMTVPCQTSEQTFRDSEALPHRKKTGQGRRPTLRIMLTLQKTVFVQSSECQEIRIRTMLA